MTTIVGIFDNTRDVDSAVERLARAGFEEVVYDEAILSEEVGNVGPVFAPGFTPVVLLGSAKPAGSRKPDRSTIIRAFRVHLANYRVPKDVIESYVINFSHKGEFVLIRTDAARAAQVIEILGECRALRVNRHD